MAKTSYAVGEPIEVDISGVTVDEAGDPAATASNQWCFVAGDPDTDPDPSEATFTANVVGGETGLVYTPSAEGFVQYRRVYTNDSGSDFVASPVFDVRDYTNPVTDDMSSYADSTELRAVWSVTTGTESNLTLHTDADAYSGQAARVRLSGLSTTVVEWLDATAQGFELDLEIFEEIQFDRGADPRDFGIQARGGLAAYSFSETEIDLADEAEWYCVLIDVQYRTMRWKYWKRDSETEPADWQGSKDVQDGVGAVEHFFANPLNMLWGYASVGFNGTSAARTPINLDSSTPADNASDVAIDATITLTFDTEPVPGTGNVYLYDGTDTLIETFDVTSDVVFSGNDATITPTSDMAYETGHYIEVDVGAIKNRRGASFAGIGDETTLNFTTVAEPDSIVVDEGSSTGTFSSAGGYRIWEGADGDQLVVTTGGDVSAIIVGGGGGGGGTSWGSGGGAGEYVYRNGDLALSATTYTATVGAGGGNTANGGNSAFAGLTAIGGGHGGRWASAVASAGGSGGGAQINNGTPGASLASDGTGNPGGDDNANSNRGGGGGGAGGTPSAAPSNVPGNGGIGVASPVPGETGGYAAGGGGGGANASYGLGGEDGNGSIIGGTGADTSNANQTAGIDGTGSGGGGAYTSGAGSSGGSGTVKVWWPEA